MRHPAEEEALCLGARTVLAEAHQERWWACLRRVQDWNYLCWAAQQHGVAGLLSQHLPEEVPEVAEGNWEIRKLGNWEIRKLGPDLTDQSQLPSCPVAQLPSCPVAQLPSCPVAQLPDPLVPPAVRERLAHLAHLTAFQNLRAQSDLERLLAAFGQEEIPVIVLKGPALIEAVYHNPALRPMLDLDLLVPRAALPAARQVMETHGYQLERPHSQHAWETEHFHLTYRRPVGDHSRLIPPCDVGAWGTSRTR